MEKKWSSRRIKLSLFLHRPLNAFSYFEIKSIFTRSNVTLKVTFHIYIFFASQKRTTYTRRRAINDPMARKPSIASSHLSSDIQLCNNYTWPNWTFELMKTRETQQKLPPFASWKILSFHTADGKTLMQKQQSHIYIIELVKISRLFFWHTFRSHDDDVSDDSRCWRILLVK